MSIAELKAKLLKMKALAERGEGGERDTAERMIADIAARYGLSLEFLDEVAERTFYINFSTGWQRDLFHQIMGLMRIERYGDRNVDKLDLFHIRGESKLKCHVVCTEEEWLELCAKYAVLKRDYKRQKDAFYYAFLLANDLLMPYDPKDKPTKADIEKAHIANSLAGGIEKSELHKQLEEKGGAE